MTRRLLAVTLVALCVALAWSLAPAAEEAKAPAAKPLITTPEFAGWKQPVAEWAMVADVALDPANEKVLVAKPGTGAIYNGPKGKTKDLLSADEFGDCTLHVEFAVSKGSNSGIYLMNSYEIQVFDSFGVEKGAYPGIECGGIYQRWDAARGKGKEGFEGYSPKVNASKAPGQWQTFDITFQAPRFDAAGKKTANAKFVKIVHNGQVIHENVELSGPTRGGAAEKATGPIRLQGDHGPVAYRNMTIQTPAK